MLLAGKSWALWCRSHVLPERSAIRPEMPVISGEPQPWLEVAGSSG